MTNSSNLLRRREIPDGIDVGRVVVPHQETAARCAAVVLCDACAVASRIPPGARPHQFKAGVRAGSCKFAAKHGTRHTASHEFSKHRVWEYARQSPCLEAPTTNSKSSFRPDFKPSFKSGLLIVINRVSGRNVDLATARQLHIHDEPKVVVRVVPSGHDAHLAAVVERAALRFCCLNHLSLYKTSAQRMSAWLSGG